MEDAVVVKVVSESTSTGRVNHIDSERGSMGAPSCQLNPMSGKHPARHMCPKKSDEISDLIVSRERKQSETRSKKDNCTDEVSNCCAKELCKIVAEEWEKGSSLDGWSKRWEIALCKAYESADNAFKDEVLAPKSVGTTAVVLIVSPCQIIAANCGDSRAVLCRGTQTIPLTVDHKPDREDELERITSSGGRILNWGCLRPEGILSMSRAIGDHDLKPWVISVPEFTFMTRTDEDECLILASDGLWDVLSNEEVVRLARKELRQQRQDVRDSFKRDARKGKGEPTNVGDMKTILANNKVVSNRSNK
ncbi:hypothetical protein V6N11_005284 [Hibiscus sabdariffa]|uniref:PPM-type phosphatase domain-containing protein n=1 Tax=Hibiscus sabdariffa TaxID=183260 RepID=A0ABR2RMD0_9ROSI